MTNELQTSASFEQKMRDRIRESIGDLIDEETLRKLIEKGIQTTFFEPRLKATTYSRREEYEPPLIHTFLKDLLEEEVSRQVAIWISENNDLITAHLKQTLDQGIGMSLIKALQSTFQSDLITLENNILTRIQQT